MWNDFSFPFLVLSLMKKKKKKSIQQSSVVIEREKENIKWAESKDDDHLHAPVSARERRDWGKEVKKKKKRGSIK